VTTGGGKRLRLNSRPRGAKQQAHSLSDEEDEEASDSRRRKLPVLQPSYTTQLVTGIEVSRDVIILHSQSDFVTG
jgi:hypothetical protein